MVASGTFRRSRVAAVTASMMAVGVLGVGVARAQVANFPPGTPKAAAWTTLPADWDGMWEHAGAMVWDQKYSPNAPEQRPPYNAQYVQKLQVALAELHTREQAGLIFTPYTSPRAGVMPGMMMNGIFGLDFEVNPREMAIWSAASADPREIYTDGRLHPLHPFLSTKGHSIGHWEGKALVVDTCCFRADTPLPDFGPHSDAMHITERIWSPRPGELADHMVVTDPKAFTRPWTTTFTYYRRPNWEEVEDDTSQNDRPLPKPGQHEVISASELAQLVHGASSAATAAAASPPPEHTLCDLAETPCRSGVSEPASAMPLRATDTQTLQKLSELGGLMGAWEAIGVGDVQVSPTGIKWQAGSRFFKMHCAAKPDGSDPNCQGRRPSFGGAAPGAPGPGFRRPGFQRPPSGHEGTP
ncbi:MAG TPA: hypothetical protein VHV80_03340 [Steroidobacteraceae bacterium]|nr:hypothetical protein [Steroidobacteraceae bacterium]